MKAISLGENKERDYTMAPGGTIDFGTSRGDYKRQLILRSIHRFGIMF